jgi:hypothetical protein
MLVVGAATVTLLVALGAFTLGLRHVEHELHSLRGRLSKLVRLSVAVDDLRHETTHVVPTYRQAASRLMRLRRTEDPEASR